MPPIQFLVERRESGKTVADVLRRRFQLTWSQAKRLVERGHVRVAGQLTRAPEQRVKTGNRMWVAAGAIEKPPAEGDAKPKKAKKAAPPPTKPAAPREKKPPAPVNAITLEIVYSDDAIAVVNKPAGLTTSRSAEEKAEFGRGKKYLPTTLAELLPAALGAPNKPVFAVHRLDRDTTGLIVFARTPPAARHLTSQFRKRSVDRRYLAVTRGVPPEGRIESQLVADRGDGRRGSGDEGERAVTHVRVMERLGAFALVECKLDTGRTHQVRIHLGEAGTPLCGERIYDRPLHGAPLPDDSQAARPLLHAFRLGIEHPDGDDFMGWEADPPADFSAVVANLRSEASKTAE
ncbi:MAG: RluA family pseudouridine synthase [Fimbriiglobus sp.]|jgi:23S rRNA pseudouridine1911/1915/1917 synthase|nr:RluA family pseudouridine synthase [Fimbriiglobus sp.]